jgi:MerR family transcriptional regulator, copper efflux regulator
LAYNGGLATEIRDEKTIIINKLTRYKLSLEKKKPELVKELFNYYSEESDLKNENDLANQIWNVNIQGSYDIPEFGGPKKVNYVRYDNPYEAYLNAQIQVSDALIPVLEQHIAFLEDEEDIDLVLESFEHSVYRVKKQFYTDVEEWEKLLDYLSEDRREEIENNPKGHGDLLLKELIWIRNYEKKWMRK